MYLPVRNIRSDRSEFSRSPETVGFTGNLEFLKREFQDVVLTSTSIKQDPDTDSHKPSPRYEFQYPR